MNNRNKTQSSDPYPANKEIITIGKYQNRDLQWRVLSEENGYTLLILDNALCAMPFNDTLEPSTWDDCTLNHWLNTAFFNEAFSSVSEIAFKGEEKLFLLDIEEATKYFKNDTARQCQSPVQEVPNLWTDSAKNCWWWLRSKGAGDTLIALVDADGKINTTGDCADYANYGVRPAMWVKNQ